MKEWCELDGMNSVSTPERERFIWAICSSLSKSETARRPFTMAVALTSRATFTSKVEMETIRTFWTWVKESAIISRRSSKSKSGSDFWGLRIAATTISSKICEARSTISR